MFMLFLVSMTGSKESLAMGSAPVVIHVYRDEQCLWLMGHFGIREKTVSRILLNNAAIKG